MSQASRYTKDYKKLRILNYLLNIKDYWCIRYTLINLPQLTSSQKWTDVGQILDDMSTDGLIMMGEKCKPGTVGCFESAQYLEGEVPHTVCMMPLKVIKKDRTKIYYKITEDGIAFTCILKQMRENSVSFAFDFLKAFNNKTQ